MSPEGSMLDLPLTGCVPLCKPLTLSGPKFYLLYTEVGAQDHYLLHPILILPQTAHFLIPASMCFSIYSSCTR